MRVGLIKKAECWGSYAFELWCWRRLLRVPWTARRSNQCILKEISPGCSLEGLTLKLKLQYFGHLMGRADSFEKTRCWERVRAGGEGDNRGWDGWMASPTQWTWVWVDSGSWWWTGRPGVLRFMGLQSRTRLSDWTELLNNVSFLSWIKLSLKIKIKLIYLSWIKIFSVLLRNNWHTSLYKIKVYCTLIYIYCKVITTVGLINIHYLIYMQ